MFHRRRGPGARWRARWAGVLYVLPMLLYLALFLIYPIGRVLYLSFFDVTLLSMTPQWAGWSNYLWAFTFRMPGQEGVYFLASLGRTVLWVGLSLLLKVSLGLAGAILLHQELAGRQVYRTLAVLPWGLPWAIVAMTWAWTMNTQFGLVNGVLLRLGLVSQPVAFLGAPVAAFVSTAVADAWIGLPFMVVMILAGLQSVPGDLLDAALVDGASPWIRFFRVTLPLVRPVVLTTALLSTVWTFNSFDPIWVMTRGGPVSATETLPIAIYNVAFRLLRFGGLGKAAAMTTVQVLVVTAITLGYLQALRGGQEGSQ